MQIVSLENVTKCFGKTTVINSISLNFDEGKFVCLLGSSGCGKTTILVYPPGTSVAPIKVYTIMANAPQSLTSAMSLIVLMITLVVLIFLVAGHKILTRRKWS